MPFRGEVGKLLRSWRVERGHTLRHVAPMAGISYSMLAQIETGASNTTLDVVESVAAALGVVIHPVVTDIGVAAPKPTPPHRRAIAERFLEVLPALPDDELDVFIHELALWERRYSEKRRLE